MTMLDEIEARHETVTRWWIDRDPDHVFTKPREDIGNLLAVIRTLENLAAHWETLAPGDQYHARMVRAAIREGLG